MNRSLPMVPLKEVLTKSEESIDINPDGRYKQVTVQLWGKGVNQRNEVSGIEISSERRIVVRYEQFILSRIDARNGAFGIIPEFLDGAVVSNDFPVFNLDTSLILPDFLGWMSKTRDFVEICKSASEGTTNRVRLKVDRFLDAEIPLPEPKEQHRIVARTEELATRIEEARELRRRAVEETEALVNSEISSIFGLLVEQKGLTQLNDLIVDAGYGTSTKCEHERSISAFPVLRIPNVADEKINFGDMKYGILDDAELSRVSVDEGDILVVRTNGSADLVGRCAVVPALTETIAFASYLIRLMCDKKKIDPNYLQLMLKYLRNSGLLFDFARTTAGQYNVSLGRLRSAKIPVPLIDEQRRIVAYLEGLQSKTDALKCLQNETAAELDALMPSILDRAFRGEL